MASGCLILRIRPGLGALADMILTDQQMREVRKSGDMVIKPFDEGQIQAATHDVRVGAQTATTSAKRTVNVQSEVLATLRSLTENVGELAKGVAALTAEVKSSKRVIPTAVGVGFAVTGAIVALD